MLKRLIVLAVITVAVLTSVRTVEAAPPGQPSDWQRFYHYPYVYYPQNFWGNEYYRSSEDLYFRYPPEMQIPVYNKKWHNEYPENRRFHSGHHFMLDVF